MPLTPTFPRPASCIFPPRFYTASRSPVLPRSVVIRDTVVKNIPNAVFSVLQEDSVRVHIDHTGPALSIHGLKGRFDRHGLFVHNSTDLSTMRLVVHAADPHSGVKTLDWMLGTRKLSRDVGHGTVGVHRHGNGVRLLLNLRWLSDFEGVECSIGYARKTFGAVEYDSSHC